MFSFPGLFCPNQPWILQRSPAVLLPQISTYDFLFLWLFLLNLSLRVQAAASLSPNISNRKADDLFFWPFLSKINLRHFKNAQLTTYVLRLFCLKIHI
jgi:hypothetical protein